MSTKKYKIGWSFWNLLNATSEEVVKIQTLWTTLSAPIIASTFITSSERNTLIALVICGIMDKTIGCLSIDKIKPKIKL